MKVVSSADPSPVLSVLMPVYNEIANISAILDSVPRDETREG